MWKFLKSIFAENEVVKSFAYNLQAKTTNPFFGTLIIVWVVRNWELVYTFLTFNKDALLGDRVEELKRVAVEVYRCEIGGFDFSGYKWDLVFCVLFAILIMLMTFFFLAFTKLINGVYQDRVLPNIYTLTSKYKVTTTEKYEELDRSLNAIRAELKKEKEEKISVESENSTLKIKIKDKEKEYDSLFDASTKVTIEERLASLEDHFGDFEKYPTCLQGLKDLVRGKNMPSKEISQVFLEHGILKHEENGIGGDLSDKYVKTDLGNAYLEKLKKDKIIIFDNTSW